MIKKNAYIVSFKYAPGLAKEFTLMGDKLTALGWSVTYLLSGHYHWLSPEKRQVYLATSRDFKEMLWDTVSFPQNQSKIVKIFSNEPPNFIYLYNPHPWNEMVLSLAKQCNPDSIRAIFLHEPFKPDKSSYGLCRTAYYKIVEKVQERCLKQATDVIFASEFAMQKFIRQYGSIHHLRLHCARLLIPNKPKYGIGERKYFSIVGNINKSKGIDEFIDLIIDANNRGLTGIEFKIITRSNIENVLKRISGDGWKTVSVINHPNISDAEIEAVVTESYAVFLSHKEATQSGNIPVAYRCGTPVIARNIEGLAQHIGHLKTGYLLPSNFTTAELYEGVRYVQEHFIELSDNARFVFENEFSESNWEKYYQWLL